jgi:hypothetical protein
MSALVAIFGATRYPASSRGLTRYFLLSGLCLAGAFAYVSLWSVLAQKVTGDELFALGTPAELHGGGLVVILTLIGSVWLLLTGFAARGAALRQRDRRIAELEAKLSELSRP